MQGTYSNLEFCRNTLKRLVRINSCQPGGNEKEMVDMICSMFPLDVHASVISHGGGRQSLMIKIPGIREEGGAVFVGHMDTVPCGEPGEWKYPPLEAVEDDGMVYGRGTADMKGGVTAMIAAARNLLEMSRRPNRNIYFCFSADEENKGLGAVALSQIEELNQASEFIIAEPSCEALGVAEKGALWLEICIKGIPSHSSRPEKGINAVEKAMEFYHRLSGNIDLSTTDPYMGKTTIAITRLEGGVSTNIIPEHARMEIDIRTLTGVCHEDLIRYAKEAAASMERECPGLALNIKILNNRPAVSVEDEHPMVKRMERIYGKMGMEMRKRGLYFYTDASQMIPVNGKPFVILGPGDDALAHQCNEHVPLKSVVNMAQFYTEYLLEYYFKEEALNG